MKSLRALLAIPLRVTLAMACLGLASPPPAAAAPAPAAPGIQGSAAVGPLALDWSAQETDKTNALAWADYDNDGDLDLAVGNNGQPNRLYRNNNGVLTTRAVWSSVEEDFTTSLAWGDFDQDGDLDLAAGNNSQPNRLYRNDGGTLTSEAVWSASQSNGTMSLAWGDVDGDGDLDLAAGSDGSPVVLYRNINETLSPTPVWESFESDYTFSLAWADADGDGDLDLAVGNFGQPSRIYRNENGSLYRSARWNTPALPAPQDYTRSVAWADVDRDGDLDLALGNDSTPNRVYCNNSTPDSLVFNACWVAAAAQKTYQVAWGDYDSDGDPDLAAANKGEPVLIYPNNRAGLSTTPGWQAAEVDHTLTLAWGDLDNDGDLDLLTGNDGQPNRLYRNTLGAFAAAPSWSSEERDWTRSVAWGDADKNGRLDLAVGNYFSLPNRLYRNASGTLPPAAGWSTPESASTNALAWGDVDGDSDLDLVVGNDEPGQLYLNNGLGGLALASGWTPGQMQISSVAWGDVDGDGDLDLAVGSESAANRVFCNASTPSAVALVECWVSAVSTHTRSVAWGDLDNDGDLDLAAGNDGEPNHVYRNQNGTLAADPSWASQEIDSTYSLAWGDVDGDGDLDLAAGNYQQFNRVYRNDGGALRSAAAWASAEADATTSVAWGDLDNDGDLDLAAGNEYQPARIYRNDRGRLESEAAWSSTPEDRTFSIALGDINNDGDLDLVTGNFDEDRAYTNLRDGRHTAGSVPYLSIEQPGLAANGFADPSIWSEPVLPVNYTLRAATRRPVRIQAEYSLNGGGSWRPAAAAPGTETEWLFPGEHTFHWDILSSGLFGKNDSVVFRLKAIPHITHPGNHVPGPFLYGSNASQTLPFRVRGTQVQVLRQDGRPARGAMVYRLAPGEIRAGALADLNGLPYRTDALGFLQGYGQLAVGEKLLALWPAKTGDGYTLYYTSAAVAAAGLQWQAVSGYGVQTLTVSSANPLAVFNLNVSLEWDARGDSQYQQQLSYDLARASEFLYDWTNGRAALGRVTVYQDREKWLDPATAVQIAASNRLHPNADMGGVVSAPRADPDLPARSYQPGKVRISALWNRYGDLDGTLGEDWPSTLAHELSHHLFFQDDDYLGLNRSGLVVPIDSCPSAMADPYRADWTEFLFPNQWTGGCDSTLAARTTGRSNWETLETFYPELAGAAPMSGPDLLPLQVTTVRWVEPATAASIQAPIYTLVSAGGGRFIPQAGARAYLFRGGLLVDLGQPVMDQVTARGAKPGDRLCVYSPADASIGCIERLPGTPGAVLMRPAAALQPGIRLEAGAENEIRAFVSGLSSTSRLTARLYRIDGTILRPERIEPAGSEFLIRFPAGQTPPTGHLWLRVEGQPAWETVVSYALGGSPAKGWDRYAPATSSDGSALLYAPNLDFPEGAFFGLQTLSRAPAVPTWASQVGSAYQVFRTAGAPPLSCAAQDPDCHPVSLAFHYRAADVPPGEEALLRIYLWQPSTRKWSWLNTSLDPERNIATAATRGAGTYALMTSYDVPLGGPGWVQFTYPILTSRPIEEALAPLQGKYTVLYRYDSPTPQNLQGKWTAYDPKAPAWANDLKELEFSKIYWIYLTENVRYLPIRGMEEEPLAAADVMEPPSQVQPPAVYYGTTGLPLGTSVRVLIGDQSCGSAQVTETEGKRVYKVQVPAGCGAAGSPVVLYGGRGFVLSLPAWANTRMHGVNAAFQTPIFIALPFQRR